MSLQKCIKLDNDGELNCGDFDIHNHTIIGKITKQDVLGIWDANSGELIKKLEHNGYVSSVAFSPDGTKFVSGVLMDNTVRIWDVNKGTIVSTFELEFEGNIRGVFSLAFSPDSTKIVTGSVDNTVRIWDVNAGTLVSTLQGGHSHFVSSVAYSPDGSKIVSGSGDYTVCVWDVNEGTLLNTLQGNIGFVKSVAFSPDGTKIVSSSMGKTVCIWETNSGRVINRFDTNSIPLIVKFNEDGTEIYVVEENNNVCSFFVLSESNITDIKTLLGPAVKERENRVNDKDVTPTLSTVSKALSTSGVRNTLLSSLYGKDDNQQTVYYKLLNPYYRRYRDFSHSIPKGALPPNIFQQALPSDTQLGKKEEEIDGGKKSKKTRRYKKNKSKRKYKK